MPIAGGQNVNFFNPDQFKDNKFLHPQPSLEGLPNSLGFPGNSTQNQINNQNFFSNSLLGKPQNFVGILIKMKKLKRFFYYCPKVPPDEQNLNYYQEYCKLFISNVVLTTQVFKNTKKIKLLNIYFNFR